MISETDHISAIGSREVDIAEIASEVVRVMFEERLNKYAAVNHVMTYPRYKNVIVERHTIVELVDTLFENNSDLRDHVKWQTHGVPSWEHHGGWTHAAISHDRMKI